MTKYHLMRWAGVIGCPVLTVSWVVLLYIAAATGDMRLFKIGGFGVPLAGVVLVCARDRAEYVLKNGRR